MRRIVARDETALRALYDQYSPLCFSVCLRVLSDRHEAEMVLTDVFAEVWRTATRFDPQRGTVAGYLIVLARSRAIDHTRSNKQVQSRPLTRSDTSVIGPDAHPASASMADEQRAVVRAAIHSLPAEQQEAVELAFFAGLSHPKIAERLSRPIGTVKTHIRMGLLRLRDILKDNETFD